MPRAIPEIVIPKGERSLPLDQAEQIRMVLSGVTVDGSTVYADKDLAPLYEAYLGREVSLSNVLGIANAITAKYRNDGYILSRAILPPQRITDGIVRITINEGFINEVLIEGKVRGRRSLLEAYANKIRNSRPLAAKDLERYLLLIDDLPGVTPKAVLTPAKDEPGASDLVIVITDKPTDGFVRIDNRGTKYNGPVQYWLGTGINSLFGGYERTTGRFITSDDSKELIYLEFGHEQQIGTEGVKLNLFLARTDSEPDFGKSLIQRLNIVSRSDLLKIGASRPMIRSRAKNLSLSGEFVVRNTETTILNQRLSRDRIRLVTLQALYDSADRSAGINQLDLKLSQGLNFFGATENRSKDLSRQNGRNDFTKFEFNASRLQRINNGLSLHVSFTSQIALSKMLSSEEFGIGGESCGRAYDPSELLGDHGACFLSELRFDDRPDSVFFKGYQIYGFHDFGRVWRKDPGALANRSSLASAGVGVRFNITNHLSGSLEIAKPLSKGVGAKRLADAHSPRGFFNLTARF